MRISKKNIHYWVSSIISIIGAILIFIAGYLLNNFIGAIFGILLFILPLIFIYIMYNRDKVLYTNMLLKNNKEEININIDNIKSICIDLDGTLLDSNEKISTINLKSLLLLQEKKPKIKLILATGRSYEAIKKIPNINKLKNVYLVCSNGALITKIEKFEPYYENPILFHKVNDIMQYLNNINVNGAALLDKGSLAIINKSKTEHEYFNNWVKRNNTEQRTLSRDDKTLQLRIWSQRQDLPKINSFLKEVGVKIFYHQRNGKAYLEIASLNVSKFNGVQKLLKLLKLNINSMIFIGNGENDLHLINESYYGVAVANAEPTILGKSNLIIDTNNNSGVGKYINSLLKNK